VLKISAKKIGRVVFLNEDQLELHMLICKSFKTTIFLFETKNGFRINGVYPCETVFLNPAICFFMRKENKFVLLDS